MSIRIHLVVAAALLAIGCHSTDNDPDVQQSARQNRELALLTERVDALDKRVARLEADRATGEHSDASHTDADAPTLELAVAKSGTVTLDGHTFAARDLSGRLGGIAEKLAGSTVIIIAEPEAPHATVLAVVDALKQAGVARYTLASRQARPRGN